MWPPTVTVWHIYVWKILTYCLHACAEASNSLFSRLLTTVRDQLAKSVAPWLKDTSLGNETPHFIVIILEINGENVRERLVRPSSAAKRDESDNCDWPPFWFLHTALTTCDVNISHGNLRLRCKQKCIHQESCWPGQSLEMSFVRHQGWRVIKPQCSFSMWMSCPGLCLFRQRSWEIQPFESC